VTMNNLADDASKNIAIFINDFDQEFADGLAKLSDKLGRPLRGIVLIDSEVFANQIHVPDTNQQFEQLVCDFSDDTALRALITSLEPHILLVTCSSERNQSYLARVLPHVPYLLGPTESSLSWSTHKSKMRSLLTSYDPTLVPLTQTVLSDSEAEIQKILRTLQFPMIVKPTGLAASILVSKVHDETELRSALQQGFAVIHDVYERDRGRGEPSFIVEEFIDGDMYSVDVYVNQSGVVWPLPFIRSRTAYALGLEGFYTYRNDSHTSLTPTQITDGQVVAEHAVHALGLRSCVAHVELFHTPAGWKIIELGPRAGGQRQDMYQLSFGVDHAYNELLVKIGLEPEINHEMLAYTTTVKFYAEQDGIITSIEGFEQSKQMDSVYSMTCFAQAGDMALLSNNGGKMIIRGVLFNTNLEQLEKDADNVRASIHITTRPA
jgi:biotin carboxylase